MRIAIPTRFAHRVGGVETYLECLLPVLVSRGHDVKVWHEFDIPRDASSLLPGEVTAAHLGRSDAETQAALDDIRRWQPDVVFSQGLARAAVEEAVATVAPFVTVLHAYQGACISGFKTRSFPAPSPCHRPLGPGCMLQFHVRRCGGWSPVTMATDYREQVARRAVLRNASGVVTLSEYMRVECVAQGVDAARVHRVSAFAPPLPVPDDESDGRQASSRPFHLAFAGRMERLKGARMLLEALQHLTPRLRESCRVTMVGDGREMAECQRLAATLRATGGEVQMLGWLTRAGWSRILNSVDLLVVPSVWPEPLGLVGLEASSMGVPALAFDVGGISDWLTDGETGRLIKDHPTPEALARGLDDCLSNTARLRLWGNNAAAAARPRTVDAHVAALESVLHSCVDQRAASGSIS